VKYAILLLLIAPGCTHAPAQRARAVDYASLRAALQERITGIDSGTVGLAFIDLATNQRIGSNDQVSMHAASTMKVPVLIELFRQAETARLSLDDSILVENEFTSIADQSRYTLSMTDDSDSTLYGRVGRMASIRELARLMIVRSSNLATNILIERTRPDSINALLAKHGAGGMHVLRGVEDTPAFRRGLNNTTTADGLARTLELIARCTVNSRRACAEMIDILADQEFNDMIPAGLPAGIRVAHKTGWITGIQHDGAIVYPPGRPPFILVVLTRGVGTQETAAKIGADLARIVWTALN
jgi:beta-lactamase class A